MKATAIASPNIALVKYWGKRDEKLILPQNSSISVVLNNLWIKTTVDWNKKYKQDCCIFNQKEFKKGSKEYDKYIGLFLNKVRKMAGIKLRTKIKSQSNFPLAAGFASSAAGFASLTLAVNKSLELGLKNKELTILARQGSGSSARSIYGGFVEWLAGKKKDGSDSFARQIAVSDYWQDFRMILCLISTKEKKIKSRIGMARAVKTSPMYKGWLATINDDLKKVKNGIIKKDFSLVGKTAEENCLKMHSLALTSKPPVIYWLSGTMDVIQAVIGLREEGVECYFTIDAGPQIKILCLAKNAVRIKKRIKKIKNVQDVIMARPGKEAKITNQHLF